MNKNSKIIAMLTLFVILGLSIGYSTYSTKLSIEDIMASIREQKDIRITGISVEASTSDGTSNYEDYNINNISSGIYLPNDDSYVTYKVTITNFEGPEMGIYAITGLPDNLEYSISNYVLKDKICDENNNCSLGITKDIYITIKYKEYDSSNTTYNLTLDLDFREVHTITYENIDGSYYDNEVLDGDTLEVAFGSDIVKCIIVDSNGNQFVDDGTYYELSNGILKVYDVSDSLTITAYSSTKTLSYFVTNIYSSADKTTVTNGGISYYYATHPKLMNDRLGGTTSDYNGGNIRYYGANPNNYVYFNCETYPSTNCELWRIIGVFDGKVKLIRNDSIGILSYDLTASTVNSGYGINQWGDTSTYDGADLMKMLNPNYDDNIDIDANNNLISINNSLYWNNQNGKCYANKLDRENAVINCNFNSSNTGMKNNITRNMISDNVWYFGGQESTDIFANQLYANERSGSVILNPSDGITRTTSWTGKISLMYASDYAYASDFTQCKVAVNQYGTETSADICSNNDWLFKHDADERILNPNPNSTFRVCYINEYGSLFCHDYGAYGMAYIRPVLHLEANQIVIGGSGEPSNPLKLLAG